MENNKELSHKMIQRIDDKMGDLLALQELNEKLYFKCSRLEKSKHFKLSLYTSSKAAVERSDRLLKIGLYLLKRMKR